MAVGLEGEDRTEISVNTYGQCPRCLVLFSYHRAHLIEPSTTENSLLHRCHYHLPKHCKETALRFDRVPICPCSRRGHARGSKVFIRLIANGSI